MTQKTARDDARIGEMLAVNRGQTEYYEREVRGRGGLFTRLWIRARIAQRELRMEMGIDEDILDSHRTWLGDLGGKRVLDLGCYEGNHLSVELARRSGEYLGLDLSRPAIARLNAKLEGIPTARARAGDFLSPEFDSEPPFDVVYAYSVSHHFKHFDIYLRRLNEVLAPGGKVITFDPLETSLPVKLARLLYRPFQSDRDWEFPFTRNTFDEISKHFQVTRVLGVLGRSKWALAMVPLGKQRAAELARRWHAHDLRKANRVGPGLWPCMQVAMCWEKLDDEPARPSS